MTQLILYELRGLVDRRYSQFSWRTRLALAHKQLDMFDGQARRQPAATSGPGVAGNSGSQDGVA